MSERSIVNRVVVDLELGRGFGYRLEELGLGGYEIAVTWSDREGFVHWSGRAGRALFHYLLEHDQIVGYNLLAYDHRVLDGYLLEHEHGLARELRARTVDLHTLLYRATGRRHSLDQVAWETLGQRKAIPPRDSDPVLLGEYCERDVELTRDLDNYRRQYGLLYVGHGSAVALDSGQISVARSQRTGRLTIDY